jgi:hypothetical protein
MCPTQNLKAVTMGMATARVPFWSNKPNPTIGTPRQRAQRSDIHPDFLTAISPVGSVVAVRFVFHLCLLPPLANNHIRLLFMRLATYYAVILGIWSCALWYAGLYSTTNPAGIHNINIILAGVE